MRSLFRLTGMSGISKEAQ